MLTRRRFLLSATALAAATRVRAAPAPGRRTPVAVGSGNGLAAVKKAYEVMAAGGDPLDAAVAGVSLVEDDPNDMTVGYGGIPNEEGVVQLDAAVFHGPTHRAGAVAALEGVKNPSRLARLVMEHTDHVLLVGAGARKFADAMGFAREDLLTEKARKVWLYWKENLSAKDKWLEPDAAHLPPEVKAFIDEFGGDELRDPRSRGTVHLSCCDGKGDLAACTSTSGLFFKIPGRVGDSPIVGAGLFTDNAVGSAGSTGRGEANILAAGGHLAVELMRQGRHPKDACVEVLKRIAKTTVEKRLLDARGRPGFGIKYYAVSKSGAYGAASMWGGAGGRPPRFAVADAKGARLEECAFLFEGKPAQ